MFHLDADRVISLKDLSFYGTFYGVLLLPFSLNIKRIEAQLRREGVVINRKTVQRHMREMGIVAIYPGPNLSRRNHKEHVFPYLLRHLTIGAPNQVWGIDITYIRMLKGWMYLVAVLDWYSRYVISWERVSILPGESRKKIMRN